MNSLSVEVHQMTARQVMPTPYTSLSQAKRLSVSRRTEICPYLENPTLHAYTGSPHTISGSVRAQPPEKLFSTLQFIYILQIAFNPRHTPTLSTLSAPTDIPSQYAE